MCSWPVPRSDWPRRRDSVAGRSEHAALLAYDQTVLCALTTIPENRVYVSPLRADAFIAEFLRFSKGNVVSDSGQAPGVEIGRPGDAYRRVRIASAFGKLTLLVTDGHLPFPYGRELTGYEVRDLTATLDKAKAAGALVLVEPFEANGRDAAMVRFPGGYIAEIYAVSRR